MFSSQAEALGQFELWQPRLTEWRRLKGWVLALLNRLHLWLSGGMTGQGRATDAQQTMRKPWRTPHVIHSEIVDSEAKGPHCPK